ncbi:MAG: hypothetical protein IJ254_05515 [Succinivibrio sp.]|nr:hypothetical protein [Succinivibrio sp.]
MSNRILDTLTSLNIHYDVLEHEPLLTMQDGLEIEKKLHIEPCKNLLLVNRQQEFFLLMVAGDKRVKVNNLAKEINSSHLSFASDTDLKRLLDVTTGAVSPLDLVSDTEHKVKVLIDNELLSYEFIGCHPGVNTMTVKLKVQDLIKVFFTALKVTYATVSC